VRRASLVFAIVSLLSPAVHAQHASAGAVYTLLSLTYPDQMPNGIGGWFSWDFGATGLVAGADAAINVFPENHPIVGRQTQALAGVRGGARVGRVGAFARVRPGVVHFSQRFFAPETVCILIFPPPESCLIESNGAVDLGGTVEVYPTARSIVRIDVGDTLIRFARSRQDAAWKHNLQLSAGAGVRF
jgi:hypothetical protein